MLLHGHLLYNNPKEGDHCYEIDMSRMVAFLVKGVSSPLSSLTAAPPRGIHHFLNLAFINPLATVALGVVIWSVSQMGMKRALRPVASFGLKNYL